MTATVVREPDTTTTEHVLLVMDHTGDTKTVWDPTRQDEVDVAKGTFTKLKKRGYLAYTVTDDGSRGEVISDFDPEAGKIIMAPPMAGG